MNMKMLEDFMMSWFITMDGLGNLTGEMEMPGRTISNVPTRVDMPIVG
jgi:hypothetical protein